MVSQHNPNENKAIEYEVSAQIGGQILLDASDTLHGGRPTVQAIQSEAIGHYGLDVAADQRILISVER